MAVLPRPATRDVRAAHRAVADPPVRPGDLAAGPSRVRADMTRPRRASGRKVGKRGPASASSQWSRASGVERLSTPRPSRAPGPGTPLALAVSSDCSDRQHDPTGHVYLRGL